jgi:hypothetical protein
MLKQTREEVFDDPSFVRLDFHGYGHARGKVDDLVAARTMVLPETIRIALRSHVSPHWGASKPRELVE